MTGPKTAMQSSGFIHNDIRRLEVIAKRSICLKIGRDLEAIVCRHCCISCTHFSGGQASLSRFTEALEQAAKQRTEGNAAGIPSICIQHARYRQANTQSIVETSSFVALVATAMIVIDRKRVSEEGSDKPNEGLWLVTLFFSYLLRGLGVIGELGNIIPMPYIDGWNEATCTWRGIIVVNMSHSLGAPASVSHNKVELSWSCVFPCLLFNAL